MKNLFVFLGILIFTSCSRNQNQVQTEVWKQEIREAERDALIEEYQEQIGQLVSGVIHEAVALGKSTQHDQVGMAGEVRQKA